MKPRPTIYALCASDDPTVRYVGFTNRPRSRLQAHRYKSLRSVMTWVQAVVARGARLVMLELERTSPEEWKQRERHWISVYAGPELLNVYKRPT